MMQNLENAQPVYREEDNELLGYTSQDNNEWLALTIFGYTLERSSSYDEALRIVKNNGLDSLMDTWQFYDSELGDWFNCRITEAKREELTIQITDYSHPDMYKVLVINNLMDSNFRK